MARTFHPLIQREFYKIHYIDEQLSTYAIAELLTERLGRKVNPNKVRDDLLYYGFTLRTRGEAQKAAFETGRQVPVMLGKTLSDDERQRISAGMIQGYINKDSDDYRAKRSCVAKDRYDKLDESSKEAFREKSQKALLESSKKGSKLERWLHSELEILGYSVEPQFQFAIANENLRIDLFLPDEKIAIECDGIFHRQDVYGDREKFEQLVERDRQKDALLLANGYKIIRIEYEKQLSKARKTLLLEWLKAALQKDFTQETYRVDI